MSPVDGYGTKGLPSSLCAHCGGCCGRCVGPPGSAVSTTAAEAGWCSPGQERGLPRLCDPEKVCTLSEPELQPRAATSNGEQGTGTWLVDTYRSGHRVSENQGQWPCKYQGARLLRWVSWHNRLSPVRRQLGLQCPTVSWSGALHGTLTPALRGRCNPLYQTRRLRLNDLGTRPELWQWRAVAHTEPGREQRAQERLGWCEVLNP